MERIKSREKLYDQLMGCALIGIVMISLVLTYRWQVSDSIFGKIVIALLQTSFVFLIVSQVAKVGDRMMRRLFVKSYYIEEGVDIIKVHGYIPLMDTSFVKYKLLKMRLNYIIKEHAFDDYGCTMVAVPAQQSAYN